MNRTFVTPEGAMSLVKRASKSVGAEAFEVVFDELLVSYGECVAFEFEVERYSFAF